MVLTKMERQSKATLNSIRPTGIASKHKTEIERHKERMRFDPVRSDSEA